MPWVNLVSQVVILGVLGHAHHFFLWCARTQVEDPSECVLPTQVLARKSLVYHRGPGSFLLESLVLPYPAPARIGISMVVRKWLPTCMT